MRQVNQTTKSVKFEEGEEAMDSTQQEVIELTEDATEELPTEQESTEELPIEQDATEQESTEQELIDQELIDQDSPASPNPESMIEEEPIDFEESAPKVKTVRQKQIPKKIAKPKPPKKITQKKVNLAIAETFRVTKLPIMNFPPIVKNLRVEFAPELKLLTEEKFCREEDELNRDEMALLILTNSLVVRNYFWKLFGINLCVFLDVMFCNAPLAKVYYSGIYSNGIWTGGNYKTHFSLEHWVEFNLEKNVAQSWHNLALLGAMALKSVDFYSLVRENLPFFMPCWNGISKKAVKRGAKMFCDVDRLNASPARAIAVSDLNTWLVQIDKGNNYAADFLLNNFKMQCPLKITDSFLEEDQRSRGWAFNVDDFPETGFYWVVGTLEGNVKVISGCGSKNIILPSDFDGEHLIKEDGSTEAKIEESKATKKDESTEAKIEESKATKEDESTEAKTEESKAASTPEPKSSDSDKFCMLLENGNFQFKVVT